MANALPWLPSLQSMMSMVSMVVEQELLRVGAVDVRLAGIEAAAEDRHDALGLVAVLVLPLPGVLELGDVARLVVGRVHVVHARLQARVHDRQILVGERHVDHEVGLDLLDQRDRLGDVVGVDLGDLDRRLAALGDLLAASEAARRQVDLLEHVAVHRALLRGDGTSGTGADDENTVQVRLLRTSVKFQGRPHSDSDDRQACRVGLVQPPSKHNTSRA